MSLNYFLSFLSLKVCISYVVVVQQILRFLSLHISYIKFIWTTRRNSRNKLKVHRANSQTISSYPVRFSTDIVFSSLVSFVFCLLVIFGFVLYIFDYADGWALRKIFTGPISGNKTTFFWHNFFLVLPIRLKTCRSNVSSFFRRCKWSNKRSYCFT